MIPVVSALLAFVASLFRSRVSLSLEHLALRHQLAVYKQTSPRPRLRPTDCLFWAWLSRLWFGWHTALAFVQPRTVISWQLRRFQDHRQCLSQQGTPGRPALAKDVRDLCGDEEHAALVVACDRSPHGQGLGVCLWPAARSGISAAQRAARVFLSTVTNLGCLCATIKCKSVTRPNHLQRLTN